MDKVELGVVSIVAEEVHLKCLSSSHQHPHTPSITGRNCILFGTSPDPMNYPLPASDQGNHCW
jgi:hypothetical protein